MGFTKHDVTMTASGTSIDWSVDIILIDSSSGNLTVTLPTAEKNLDFIIKNSGKGTPKKTVTIDRNGAKIDDKSVNKVLVQNEAIRLICDGTDWWIL